MKIDLIRQSGEPIKRSDREQYEAEFKAFYDKADLRATERAEAPTQRLAKFGKMIYLQRFMRFGEHVLQAKFDKKTQIDLPQSAEDWQKLLSEYEDTPILVAKQSSDRSKTLLVIMDQLA